MMRMTHDQLDLSLGEDHRRDPSKPMREALQGSEGGDSAAIVQLTDGRYAFIHDQPATNGQGMVIAADVAICEDAARRARYLGEPSTIATRLGLTVLSEPIAEIRSL